MTHYLKPRLKSLKNLYEETFSMDRETFEEYIETAVRFLDNVLRGHETGTNKISAFSDLVDAAIAQLSIESKQRTGNGWRKLRRSVVVLFEALGHPAAATQISSFLNPTESSERPYQTGKSRRLITVSDEDFEKMRQRLLSRRKWYAYAACVVARIFGLRPCELPGLQYRIENNVISVNISARKSTKQGREKESLRRGIDREIFVPYSSELERALQYCAEMRPNQIGNSQNAIRDASKALWPRRKTNFCLYSFRYTLGSHMKAVLAEDPDKDLKIAGVFGHKRTSSAKSYGNIRSGNGGFSIPTATEETLARVTDDQAESKARWRKQQATAKPAMQSDPGRSSPSF